ncbi:MAG: redoxin domain-containing protein [Planctomycetes bacterium]|nr:redoxin domain-containing protein [Planctomycetota bacterium]
MLPNSWESRSTSPLRRFAGQRRPWIVPWPIGLPIVGLLVLIGCSGCPSQARQSPSVSPSPSTVQSPVTAEELWNRTRTAYRTARAYRDQATIRLTYLEGTEPRESSAPLSVQYAAPNKIRFQTYRAEGASDGQQLRIIVHDEDTGDIDHQIIVRTVGQRLGAADLTGDPLLYAQATNAVVTGPWGKYAPQFDWLLGDRHFLVDDGLEKRNEPQLQLLESDLVEGHRCQRLEAATPHGKFLFWIDESNYVIRRMRYPNESLEKQMLDSPEIKHVQLVAEFHGAELLDQLSDASFQLPIPDGARQVQFFVAPPQPLPSKLFGQQAGPFSLHDPGGGRLTRDDIAGKFAVLLWFSDHPTCATTLQQFDRVRLALETDDRFRFHAVCTEPSTMSNQAVEDRMRRWNVKTPLLRDLDAHGLEMFQIVGTPTVVVLDTESRVQIFEMGANPRLEQQLPAVLRRLGNGEDLAAELLRESERERQEYERRLTLAASGAAPAVIDIPAVEIKPHSEPRHLRLETVWSLRELSGPGNITVFEDDGKTRFLILDQSRQLVQVNVPGEIERRFALPQNEQDSRPFSIVRTARTESGGRVYALAALFGRKMIVLDERGAPQWSYPPDDEEHPGIHDVLVEDLDADGNLEFYVAFWGTQGIHALGPDGQRNWSDRTMLSVLSLAASAPNAVGWRKLLAAGETGRLLRVNQFGNADRPIDVPNWAIHQLFGARFALSDPAGETTGAQVAYGGISYASETQRTFVALNEQFQEQWNYPLPPGQPRNPIEFVTSGWLISAGGEWVIAAADGSVHMIAADGEFSDYFCVGEELTGIAAARTGDRGLLLIATPTAVTALAIHPVENAR